MLGLTVPGPRAVAQTIATAPHSVRELTDAAGQVLHRTRRVADASGRLHIEVRDLDGDETKRFAGAVEDALAEVPGVAWARLHTPSHRLVVAAEPEMRVRVLDTVEAVERDLGLDTRPFPAGPDHPADTEPILRDLVGIGADLVGVTIGSAARLMHVPAPPVEVDLVAAANVVDQVLPVRRAVESVAGSTVTDLTLGFGTSILQALTAGPAAPAVDLARRSLLLREMEHRRHAWELHEARLFDDPPDTPPELLSPPSRPHPLPDGSVERYSRRAIVASALGSAATALLSGRPDQAVSVLQSGLPKAATLGREAFAAAMGCTLADHGVLVFDPAVLRLLDRVDCVVVDTDLLGDESWQVPRELVTAAATGAAVRLVVTDTSVGDPADHSASAVPDLLGIVRDLQREGHVVALATTRPDAAIVAADIGLGVRRPGAAVPWGAALLASQDATDLLLLLMAIGEAREVVHDSLRLAAGGSIIGALISVASLGPGRVAAAPSASSVAGAMTLMDGARRARALTSRRMPVRVDTTRWHALAVEDVLRLLDTRADGLSTAAARDRTVSGPRATSTPRQFLQAVRHELANPLTPILAAGAGLSAMAGSLGDAVLVSGVVMSNAVVGGAQRLQADRAMAALLRARPRRVTVFRDGQSLEVQALDLVRGDVVRLQAGEAVPADCRIIGGRAIEVDESALTGESLPVPKSAQPVAADLAVAERTCMLYEGTWVAAGEVTAVVVATGEATEARRAVLLAGTPPEAGVEARLHEWTTRTIPLAIGGGAAVMLSGLLRGRPLRQTLGAGVSLAVAAVPEGLPLLATAAQLAAARRLARHNVLVRNPRAIEALGRVDVLCADKTGTLTEGNIELRAISNGRTCRDADDLDEEAHRILRVALRATPVVEDPQTLPHPTDRAVARAGLRHAEGLDALGVGLGGWSASYELPFEPGRGFHAAAGSTDGGGRVAVKGAPEAVLPRCTLWQVDGTTLRLGPGRRARVAAEVDRMAALGLRVLAVASGDLAEPRVGEMNDDALTGLTLRGLLAMADPARATSAEAVRALATAGVRTIMITGDHPSTARGIGVELGLLDSEADGRMMTGPQIDDCDDAALAERVTHVRVFARVTPAHKVRIVRALQGQGHAVAMTGDGANDAPAIRLADVGIALGTRGTAAAQSAADMVVLDDRIETLTQAIAEGRALWGAVRDAVAMLVGGNIGEITFTVLGSVVDGTPPLNARQLLLVNTLTDALPAIAIAVRRPRQRNAALLDEGPDRSLGSALDHAIAAQAIGAVAATTATWGVARVLGPRPWARTVGLATIVGTQLGNTLMAGGRDPFVALSALGSAVVLETEPGVPTDSVALREAAERRLRQRDAERIILDDPLVQEMMRQFKTARIVPGSIKPH